MESHCHEVYSCFCFIKDSSLPKCGVHSGYILEEAHAVEGGLTVHSLHGGELRAYAHTYDCGIILIA